MNLPHSSVEQTIARRLGVAQSAKFFVAIATARQEPDPSLHRALEDWFGALEEPGIAYCFSRYSAYYDAELGGEVWKYLVGFKELLASESLVEVKTRVERLQWEHARDSARGPARSFNLDPGYVNGWQVVLATVKNRAHRLYLGGGVFGEVTLQYRKGEFHPLPWTYPDYCEAPVLDYLRLLRGLYLNQSDVS